MNTKIRTKLKINNKHNSNAISNNHRRQIGFTQTNPIQNNNNNNNDNKEEKTEKNTTKTKSKIVEPKQRNSNAA